MKKKFLKDEGTFSWIKCIQTQPPLINQQGLRDPRSFSMGYSACGMRLDPSVLEEQAVKLKKSENAEVIHVQQYSSL